MAVRLGIGRHGAAAVVEVGEPTRPNWQLDLHRHESVIALAALGVHLAALVADSYVHISVADLVVPLRIGWRPGAVAWGIVAAYVLVAVQATSLMRRRLPKRLWKAVHLGSYGAFAASTVHTVAAGTDASNPLLQWSVLLVTVAVVSLTVFRITVSAAARPQRVPSGGRVASVERPSRAAREGGARRHP